MLRPRTTAAIGAARSAGIHFLIVTGRMFQSVRPYAVAAGITDPVVCYQGAVVADPVTGEFLRHVPMPEAEAREVIGIVEATGRTILVYVDDELYVAHETPETDAYSGFQHLEVNVVGELLAWLPKAPTKLVVVGDPHELDALEVEMKAHFGDRLYISKSLPHFLEFASPAVHKGAGLDFAAARLGFGPRRVDLVRRRRERRRTRRVGRLRHRRRERASPRAGRRGLRLSVGGRRRRGAGTRGVPGPSRPVVTRQGPRDCPSDMAVADRSEGLSLGRGRGAPT